MTEVRDAAAVLDRWHVRGHPEVPLDGVRRVPKLPLWLSLLTPGSETDLDAVRAFLGMRGTLL